MTSKLTAVTGLIESIEKQNGVSWSLTIEHVELVAQT